MKGERGRYIQYKYENNQANQYWEVYSTILMFSIKRYYKEKGE